MIRSTTSTLFLFVVLVLPALARAETRRVAIIVGNNRGGDTQPQLNFAEADADKLSHVLLELGGVTSEDLTLLKGQTPAQLRRAVSAARAKAEAWQKRGDRVVLLFYFSGHSDGEALELGRERVPFGEVRSLLEATGADLRVAIVDTCKSGALLAVKGGKATRDFQIRLSDELVSKGEALLTSSAASEVALESREIGGSFFTHHLVSGLRGAADRSSDGRVTLAEAYDYAFARTVSATARTVVGAQHPAYDYRIAGEGELVLAQLGKKGAVLELPRGFERTVVVDLDSDRVLAEIPQVAVPRLTVPAGRFRVIGWQGAKVYEGEVTLGVGATRVLQASELKSVRTPHLGVKGRYDDSGFLSRKWYERVGGSLALGATQGVAAQLSAVPTARITAEFGGARGMWIGAQGAGGQGAGFRETDLSGMIGGRYGWENGRFSVSMGAELGGGAVVQRNKDGRFSSALGFVAPTLSSSVRIAPTVSAFLHAHYAFQMLQQDGELKLRAVPAAWLGVRVP
jgi:uncharacterized caspase-like protein